jgi:uncharacterized repeat protein (TIGR03803 family)
MTRLSAWKMACGVVLLCAATAIASPAQVFKTLATFDGYDGSDPLYMSLVQGTNGNFYGTTTNGGTGTFGGVVFEVTPSGTLTAVQSFGGAAGVPVAGLILGTDGNFYGTTQVGGGACSLSEGCGTVFKVSPGGTLTILHAFDESDGLYPESVLIQATDGNFYGTTTAGGSSNQCLGGCGTVFKITPKGTLTTLHNFDSTDGSPIAGLVQATDGNFYGTTVNGGNLNCNAPYGCGTVFRMTSGGALTAIYKFCAQSNCTDGAYPWAALVQATDGNFYGTTAYGGGGDCSNSVGAGCGTIFQVTPTGTLTTLHSFELTDGARPYATLVQATDEDFYGTTSLGGNLESCAPETCGTVFKISSGGTLTTLHSFDGIDDGTQPNGGLLQSTDGTFYGATALGGNHNDGTVFSLSTGLGPFVALVRNPAKVGQLFGILGQGFIGTKGVSLNGIPASFTVKSRTLIEATVPPGATTGYVTVVTPSGTLTSNVPFRVIL